MNASRWPVVRATLITVVLFLQLLDAIPLPELRPQHLKHPIAKAEVKRWSGLLSRAGVSVSEEELTAVGLSVGQASGHFRSAVLAPWRPFRTFTGTGQAWGLFAFPETAAGRLVIEKLAGEERTVLFRAPDAMDPRLNDLLHYRRVRGIYDDAGDRPKPRVLYERFAAWLADEVMRAHPDATAVEIRLDRHLIVFPADGVSPPDERRHVRLFHRDAAGSAP